MTGLDDLEPRASIRDEADPGEDPAAEVLDNSEGRFYFKVADRWSQSATPDIAGAVIGQQIRRLGLSSPLADRQTESRHSRRIATSPGIAGIGHGRLLAQGFTRAA